MRMRCGPSSALLLGMAASDRAMQACPLHTCVSAAGVHGRHAERSVSESVSGSPQVCGPPAPPTPPSVGSMRVTKGL
ncbi:MAG: hypothetical protein J3K34DRAFT_427900 [Monoraphidium minutum]|nr:MAG: hypothetical protein J3K34DRAFT_427900 [Monoraphidium minutum]